MNGVAQWNVYGPVETLQTEFAEWDLLNEEWQTPRHSSLARFHRDRRIDEREHHNPNGSVSRTSYIYDESGRMIETRSRLDDGPIHKTLYLYDGAGRPLRTVRVEENGIQHDFEICSYDESGRKSKVSIAPKLEPHVGYYFSLEGTETSFGATGAVTMTTLYDDREQPAEALLHDANQFVLRRVQLTRDSAGRLVKEEIQLGEERPAEQPPDMTPAQMAAIVAQVFGAARIMSSTTYAYDEAGRRVERRTQMGGLSEERTTYRFDDHDNPVEETTEDIRREMNLDETGKLHSSKEIIHRRQVQYEYECDGHGNWTKRVVSVRLEENPDFQRSNVERRKITYYRE
ncbi:MAG: hypothetical protein DMG13_34185 [Acidobacteria bacterium]|nr:MAG: hypothetical protein DMG13_34185 [Acidobacteriota bacterium]